ncbi:MAG: hypothetical protein RM049_17780 [Nostoc sp. DedQUE04]|uniref:hypothetical protein n=1 Tax=unclassified Nostoc TaxID=2593658 RepID=UPI002AD499B5|nr:MULTISPECIES: hypothetical protein [unclassified Nostoc]MDZ8091126.1 hypothetical protein [Nostoc sp. DedQUE05]MDZ8137127.1 hypothetical protein [Nostoc sp. DedQUE04]
MQWKPDNQTLLAIAIVFIATCFFGGVVAGIATLIITRKNNFFVEIFRLLIGAIGGYESVLIWSIFSLKNKNSNEILKAIIYYHQTPPGFFLLSISIISGAIGASIAIFMMRKVFRWRS